MLYQTHKSLTVGYIATLIRFMNWNTELRYFVTPKSGPMRAMRTLRDVNHALMDDLTPQHRYQRHWFTVGRLLLAAAGGETRLGVMLVTDALVAALEIEGWIAAQRHSGPAKIQVFRLPATAEPVQRAAIMQAAA